MLEKNELATSNDTLDGITHWCLVQQSIIKIKSLVEKALEQLVEQGKTLAVF